MSKFIFTTLLVFALFACAEENEAAQVPANVIAKFEAAYPGATDVEWEVDGDEFEVEFKMNGEEMEVEYDANGMVVEIDD